MTVNIVGHWESGWRAPLEEYHDWIHPLREFNVDTFYMSPITGIARSKVIERRNIEEIFDEMPNLTRVYVDESATVELPDFEHPEDAVYILGKTGYSPYATHKRPGDLAVKIPTNINRGGFWGHQASLLILYDRYLKSQATG